MIEPRATYRLQLHAGFTFADAQAAIPYFVELGVSHLYLSPVLHAAEGSTHGYDVVDPEHISEPLGGEEAFTRLATAAHAAGIGILLDIVPNHMSIAGRSNRWWSDVLENGPSSYYAHYFDVDWGGDDRIVLPILGERYGRAIQNGAVKIVDAGPRAIHVHGPALLPLDLAPELRGNRRPVVRGNGVRDAVVGSADHDPTEPRAVRHLHFEVWLHGTRSTAVDPAPSLATWARLRYDPGGDGPRNVAWLGIKTPGVILNEMNITEVDVRALGRDVYATFRRPWEVQFEQARGRFKRERGREPGIGNDSDPKAEFAQVYAWMDPPSTAEDSRWKAYQGPFVHAWGEFERSWEAFYEENKGAWARMWRGTFDQALDFRRRVQDWRQKFEALGGAPSAPAPHIPDETSPLGDIPWRSIVVAAGGIAAGVLVLPPVIRAMRKAP